MARVSISLSQLLQSAQASSALRVGPQDAFRDLVEELSSLIDLDSSDQRGQVEAALIKKGYSLDQIREFFEGSTKPEQDLGLDKK